MTPDHLLVWAIVLAAALYLLRGALRRKESACGGCNSCPSTKTDEPKSAPSLIQLEVKPRRPAPAGPPERPSPRSPVIH
jgi:hypothetical protein